jgi:integrase
VLQDIFSANWEDIRCKAAALLSFYTGARLGEIRGLRWKNVSLSDGYVNIVENYVEGDGLKEPKWQSIRESVDIPEIVIQELEAVKNLSRWKPTKE